MKRICLLKILFSIGFLTGVLLLISCQTALFTHRAHTFMFYNVENLFDTINDPFREDNAFTPEHEKNWNTEKYNKKLTDLARVIASVDTVKFPVVIGLAEVENSKVLIDLLNEPLLKPAGYRFIWEEGPDNRGIDCALLYQPRYFRIDTVSFIRIAIDSLPQFTTRDIIYTGGWLGNDYLHIFVNHWPSRRGGEEVSQGFRDHVASVLRGEVDCIFETEPDASIVIMGDMNDEPGDSSLRVSLNALPNHQMPGRSELVNLMYDEFDRGEGSYSYRGDWSMIDNIIVSSYLITREKGYRTTLHDGHVFHQPFMEYVNDRNEISPNRTYGRTYFGGISDHFPVWFQLKK